MCLIKLLSPSNHYPAVLKYALMKTVLSCTFLNFKQNLVQVLEEDLFYLSYLTLSYLHLPVFLQLTNTGIITKS